MSNLWGNMPINTISFICVLLAAMGIWLGWLLHAEVAYRIRKHKHRERKDMR